MNILVIGGSGFLGSFVVKEAVKRGYTVTVLSRGREQNAELGPHVKHVAGDVYTMSKTEFENVFDNQYAVVYALGLDDRQLHDKPVYRILHNDHVDICLKVVHAAHEYGVKKFVVFGSYFTHFDRINPELKLSYYHPYIKTRREQSEAVVNQTVPGFDTFVLEIPYIIGSLPGKVPAWTFILDMLAGKAKWAFFFLKGGTAAVTPKQVADAAIGAIEKGKGGTNYPIGGMNISWTDFSQYVLSALGEKKNILNIPAGFFIVYAFLSSIQLFFLKKARGLNLYHISLLQNMEAYIDPKPSMSALGYVHDDYNLAISDMVKEWKRIKENKAV